MTKKSRNYEDLSFVLHVSKMIPINIYLFKDNNKNTRKRCEICSKLIIKIPERPQ